MISRLLPRAIKDPIKRVRNRYFPQLFSQSYSQEGEDMVLRRLFDPKQPGFFVDVGAYHPKRYSNTYLLYRQGWRGINIDPNPDTHTLLKRLRPRDTSILAAVSSLEQISSYYMFEEPAFNTLDRVIATEYQKLTKLLREIQVNVRTLSTLLHENVPPGTSIDLFNVDVEGLDLQVLQSNDWSAFSPRIVLIEQFGLKIEDIAPTEIAKFLGNKGYAPIAKTINSVFYKRN